MEKVFEEVMKIFDTVIEYSILIIEIIGVAVLMFTVIRGVIHLIKKKKHIF